MTPINQLYEHIYVAGQLSENDFKALAEQGIKTIINNRPDNEEANQLNHEKAAQLAADNGIHYYYLPMANGQPLSPQLIQEFKSIIDATTEPILAHCRSGMRSSFIWALGQIAVGAITAEQAIAAANSAGIPLQNARPVLEQAETSGEG